MTERHYEVKPTNLHTLGGADSNGIAISCESLSAICAQISGSFSTGAVYWEGTVDGTNWIGILGWNRNTGVKALSGTAAGLWVVDVTGLNKFRARLDWTDGTVTVTVKGSSSPTTTLVTAT